VCIFCSFIIDGASRYPDTEEILKNSSQIGDKAMSLTAISPCVGPSGKVFKELIGHVAGVVLREKFEQFSHTVCSNLVKGIANKKCLLPSALATSLLEQVENVLSSQETQNNLLQILQLGDSFNSHVLNQFMLQFCLKFSTEILKFVSSTFRDRSRAPSAQQGQQGRIVELDKEDRQVVYYIAGSIMRAFLKNAKKAKKSSQWQNVAAAIKSKILMDKPVADMVSDCEWTSDVDRGGLLYITADCQFFFVNLTKVVFESETFNGSLPYDTIISKVSNSDLSVQWDNIISDSLPESVSVDLMNDTVLYFSRSCGRGFARRRLSFLRKRPVVSMATRHFVASRKNR